MVKILLLALLATDVDSDDGSDMKVDSSTGNSGIPQSDPDTDICTHAGKKELVPQCLLEWPSRLLPESTPLVPGTWRGT